MAQKRQKQLHIVKTGDLQEIRLETTGSVQANPSVESRALPQSRYAELRLAAIDCSLLFFGAIIMIGLGRVLDPLPFLHEGMFVALNMALAFGFSFLCCYMDLSDGRYSLGKAILIGFSLWAINVSLIWFTASGIPIGSILIFTIGYGFMSLASGWFHFEASRPFMVKKSNNPYYRLERRIKRVFDATASLLGLLIISPLMVLVPILLCLESKGSPIFIQARVGEKEKLFPMFKFRSMVIDSNNLVVEKKAVLYKRDDDPRVTRLGRIIRKLSIDELPQLFNVVRGEMSLVGPRPPLPSEFELMNWYHRRKFEAIPGMTGLWQISGRTRNQRDFNSVAAYDIYYVENWCLMEDLLILLKTVPVVVFQRGAC